MRYKIDQDTGQVMQPAGDGMFTGTTIYSLIISVVFIVAGLKARQRWIVFWGAGLALASLVSLFTRYYDLL